MKIVMAGAGEVGSHLAKMLSQSSNEIVVIDSDGDRLERLEANADVMTVEGNPTSVSTLKEAGTEAFLEEAAKQYTAWKAAQQ